MCITSSRSASTAWGELKLRDAGGNGIGHHAEISFVCVMGITRRRNSPVAVTNNHQEVDTGTKMIHIGKNTRVRLSQGNFGWQGQNSYRGLVKIGSKASERVTTLRATLVARLGMWAHTLTLTMPTRRYG